MRPVARLAITAFISLLLTLPLTEVAVADPDPTTPTERQLQRAERDVRAKKTGVADLQKALEGANVRMQAAVERAGFLAEQYNGAMWRLSEARTAKTEAEAAHAAALEAVEGQRVGIITLVTDSYQNGTELNTATALMSDEGPKGLMNRYAVVQSAGDSMEASYERFRAASAAAEKAADKSAQAEHKHEALAEEARRLRDEAGAAANAAAFAANTIAVQRIALVEELAEAQDVTVELAAKRQRGLERIAQQKAAAAAKAKQAADATAAKKEAAAAKRRAAAAKRDADKTDRVAPVDRGLDLGPAINYSPKAPGQGATAAVNYAKLQIGKPYVWAAVGPNAFDCSGLTMRAWEAGGKTGDKTLPHFSGAQFQMGQRIAVEAARAGDLYFWTNNNSPSGIHHVALAIGGGQFIEAARTGVPVRYNSTATYYPDYAVRLY